VLRGDDFAAIIVGGGPAGSAAAIRLLSSKRALAKRVLVLDKATFPRPKVCGGGITHAAEDALAVLGLDPPPATVAVRSVEFRLPDRTLSVDAERLSRGHVFKVVCRKEFDHFLLLRAAALGAVVHEGEAVRNVSIGENDAVVTSDLGEYRAPVVIAADGANSAVRRVLGFNRPRSLGAASESIVPAAPSETGSRASHDGRALFDFTPILHGLQGYYWEFPTISGGRRATNIGVADARLFPPPRRSVVTELRALHGDAGPEASGDLQVRGAAIRWFNPATPHSAPRLLFAGDAAGAEPLFSEGISTALRFGIHTADATLGAIAQADFSFSDYDRTLAASELGRILAGKLAVARRFYAGSIGEVPRSAVPFAPPGA
jgi:flavin-dependent dehydrogenase